LRNRTDGGSGKGRVREERSKGIVVREGTTAKDSVLAKDSGLESSLEA
jgi:hypothetical protein